LYVVVPAETTGRVPAETTIEYGVDAIDTWFVAITVNVVGRRTFAPPATVNVFEEFVELVYVTPEGKLAGAV
jgi:hypothetical protein